MKVLIIYATNSGSTYEVTKIIESVLDRKHTVTVQKAAESKPADVLGVDLVLFGSPSWRVGGVEGQIQEIMQEFLDSAKGKLPRGFKFAVFGCGDPDFTHFCQAVDTIVERLKKEGGALIFEPLKIDGFYFHLEN